jgi:hypothetical protein
VNHIKAKSFTIRTMFTFALGCAAVVAPGCGGDDMPPDPGRPGMECGGFAGILCPAGMYCDHQGGTCGLGDMMGTCRKIPDVCTQECTQVCGCDGTSYCNACLAHLAGVDDSAETTCYDADSPPPPTAR